MLTKFRTLLVAILILAMPARADFEAGQRAYDAGDYTGAFREWLQIAERGNVDAQRKLGDLFLNGEGVDENYGEALRWYRRAAEQGDAKAEAKAGSLLIDLVNNPQDDLPITEHEAIQWHQKVGANPKLKQLADRGDAEAQFVYATYLRWDTYCVKQYVTGKFDINNPLDGEGREWLRKAAEQGYPQAEAKVALDYVFDASTAEMDANKAKAEADYAEAARWYRAAAEHGNRGAQAELAGLYEKGIGLSQSYADAAMWSLAAAKRGDREAQYDIGIYSYEGSGIQRDYEAAFLWWKRYVAPGPPKRDISTPDEWMRHYFTATVTLGEMYIKGLGTAQNISDGIKLFQEAAKTGDRQDAQQRFNQLFSNQASMYRDGREVAQDYGKAAKWFRVAAEGGDPFAQTQLGILYYDGQGVPKDYIQAYVWLNLAAAQDGANAGKVRDIVEKKLASDQIAEAQRIARDWRPHLLPDLGPSTASVFRDPQ